MKGNIKIKYNFYLPLLIVISTATYGTIWLHYEVTGSLVFTEWATSPYVLTHQIIPKKIWPQMDFGLWFDIFTALMVYLALVGMPDVKDAYKMYQQDDNIFIGKKQIHPEDAVQMIEFRKRIKIIMEMSVFGFYLLLDVFLYTNLYWNNTYQTNLHSVLFWFLVFPLFMFYIVYALFGSILFVVLATRYIRIRQKGLMLKLQNIIENIRKSDPRRDTFGQGPIMNWREYIVLHRELFHICRSIKAYNRFCWPLLTANFPYYIAVQCYLLYVLLFQDISSSQRPTFYIAVGMCNFFLFIIIQQCAYVSKHNYQIEELNRSFYFNFMIKGGFRFVRLWNMLKAQSLQTDRRLQSYSFKLLNNYRITNKTYHLILTYMSAFFFFIAKKQYENKYFQG